MTRRRLLAASATALVAGVTAYLALAAVVDAYGDLGAAVAIALTAVWLTQAIRPLLTPPRHRSRRP